jgi:DNA polymerase (family X)
MSQTTAPPDSGQPLASRGPATSAAPNAAIARRLGEVAALLQEQGANPFRIRAYQNASAAIETLPIPVNQLYEDEGLAGLERIPGIGPAIARAIQAQLTYGRMPMLDRLRGESDPIELLTSIPGIGTSLALRLHDDLGITTLEELELAAHEGRLGMVRGIGPKRLQGIIAALAMRLGRPRSPLAPSPPPPVGELLEIDREYLDRAQRGELPTIAPRRFNRGRRAWLPVLHTTRGERHYTALFSNTALAHRLGRTRDWVVIYGDGDREEHQATVVTERNGPLAGRRVVRGRESECMRFYRGPDPAGE